jgi:hypothetical protein
MTNRRLGLLLLLGLIGYGSLAVFFPRFDTAAQWKLQLDHAQTLAQAKALAVRYGVDVTGWDAMIRPVASRNHERYLSDHRAAVSPFELTVLSPLKIAVKFRDPRENRTVNFTFAANGQLLSFDRTGFKLTEADKAAAPNQAQADQAIAELIGEARARFAFTSEADPEKGRKQWVWSYVSPTDRELKFDAEASVSGATLTRVEIKSTLPKAYSEELTGSQLTSLALLGGLEFVFNMLCVMAALVLYFLSLNRKEVDHLSSLLFFGVALLLFLLGTGLTTLLSEYSNMRVQGITNPTLMLLLPYIAYGLTCFFLALLLTAFWAAGEALHAKYQTGRLSVFAATLRGKLFTRAAAHSVTAGLLTGGLLAALPYLFAFVGRLAEAPIIFAPRHNTLAAAFPVVATFFGALVGGEIYYLLLLFAFVVPAFGAYLRSTWLARGLFLLAGLSFLLDLNPNESTSWLVKIAVTLVWLALFIWLYRAFDLLAVLSANFAAAFVLKAFGLYVQTSPTLHAAGIKSLVLLGVLLLVALALTRLAPAAEVEPRRLLTASEDTMERERLKAEFGVARKAQENLLPAASPNIPGFGIAGLCRPARECGGDLYDFIALPDGKLGIVVADVSGKGVPAALYMTLTKGLLLSVSEDTSDPGAILREVNKHLYEVCKRKTFVTLFFGVLDPSTKTLTYSRAGHNPPVWRRQADQTTHWLKPAGIGLGLNAGKSFDRVLAVEQIQLSKNDLLIFYSDGITEAMNEQQEEYGEERLLNAAQITDGMGAEESLNAVFASVSGFLGTTPPQDDQTLVVVRAN